MYLTLHDSQVKTFAKSYVLSILSTVFRSFPAYFKNIGRPNFFFFNKFTLYFTFEANFTVVKPRVKQTK